MAVGCVGVRWTRLAALAGSLAMAMAIVGASPAEARKHHRRAGHAAARQAYAPPFSAMVVDANSGRKMYAVSEDELRHPASVTKVMTLYLLFEQLERGKLKLDSELRVSRHSASMAPSKLGLAPGDTIEVEDAIKAIVTRSANDVAATIAENIGGTEEGFAVRMTRKARQLGMSRTVYRNASGLPDREQVTTARDLTVLARAIQEKFPKYYKYFQTRSFVFRGQTIGNHNRLLGRVEGVDGIKTGFTNASGFNLMTSARLDGRHVVGVVLGGRSASSRDSIMAGLIRTNLARAAPSGNASVFAEVGGEPGTQIASADDDDVGETASLPETPARRPAEPAPVRVAATLAPTVRPAAIPQPGPVLAYASTTGETVTTAAPRSPDGRKIEGRLPSAPAVPAAPAYVPLPPAPLVRAEMPSPRPQAQTRREPETKQAAAPAKPAATAAVAVPTSPWVIQLAAENDETKARDLLDEAKSRSGRLLARAAPFTERVVRGNATLYRARFSGFEEADTAQEACKALKRSGFSCFATRS